MRSPHSTVPEVKITAGVVITCSECGQLDGIHTTRPTADLAARTHLAAHAPRRTE